MLTKMFSPLGLQGTHVDIKAEPTVSKIVKFGNPRLGGPPTAFGLEGNLPTPRVVD